MFGRILRNSLKVVLAFVGLLVTANSAVAASTNPLYLALTVLGLAAVLNPLTKLAVVGIYHSFTSRRMPVATMTRTEDKVTATR